MKIDNFEGRMEKYHDNGETTEKFLGGHTSKSFVRLDDNAEKLKRKQNRSIAEIRKTDKDSLFFGELFRELIRGKCHYVTYLNDTFVGKKKKDTYIPHKVSCLIKKMDIQSCYFSECVGSRLANELGVPTVFNVAHAQDIPEEELEFMTEEEKSYRTYDYLISVDYVPWGFTTENLQEMGISFNEDTPLSEIMKQFDESYLNMAKDYGLKIDVEQYKDFKKAFAKQFLFRQLLCEDLDFEAKNVGMLISENGDFCLAPCFDMELLFAGAKSRMYYNEVAKATIEFMQENMPEVLDQFINAVNNADKKGKVDFILKNTLKVRSSTYKHILENVKTNIMVLDELVKRHRASLEESQM